ncbi:bis(5'-nucleosyl)-tetraphosphatase (symmetrical) YqeK [Clostridium oryzae]|uniref:Putative nicotinate-nucleotide adenylyltransferase n=1 Tax=Clostridium oryzae TaxID=1450648 RepID=A0A1V4IW51_9CLOT|nr:bis(5'-nucleosyl)-tetraphosphatase (symmetrical) YqeK [Clostridium oryzae]OPJ64025.1 putative nicotinate-nucleotide adenylyltransferase [Clostridium oryzae]
MNKIFTSITSDFEFTGNVKKDSYDLLIKHGRFVIAEHTLRVVAKARSLAAKYGIDEEAAELAALLHDIGGVYPNSERLQIAELLGLKVLKEEKELPLILHQKISKVMAKDIFGITDKTVLDAIGCHTTLRPQATQMDMLIFISDKLEWDKKGIPPYSAEVEEALSISLEAAAFKFIKYQLKDREKLAVVHPWLKEAFEDLKSKINE